MKLGLLLTLLLCLLTVGWSYKFVELSHTQNTSTVYWPGVPTFNRTVVFGDTNAEGVWIEVGAYSSGEHGGTHIDVPRHFMKKGLDLNDMPLDRFVAEGVMVDCTAEAEKDYDYAVTVEKLQQWEAEHGRIPDDAAVLFYFGYAQKFTDPTAYLNTQDVSSAEGYHFPIVSIEAARWLTRNRYLKMIGMDVPSPDSAQSTTFPVHLEVLPRNIVIMENVNIPPTLPPRDFRIHASPVRIQGGTGTPTRIYAMLYDRMEADDAAVHIVGLSFILTFSSVLAALVLSRLTVL